MVFGHAGFRGRKKAEQRCQGVSAGRELLFGALFISQNGF